MENKKNKTKRYIQIRLSSETAFSYDYILKTYGVKCDFLKNDTNESIIVGFNVSKEEKFINCFINQGWDLISVSEDQKSIAFHLVKNT